MEDAIKGVSWWNAIRYHETSYQLILNNISNDVSIPFNNMSLNVLIDST